MSTSGTAPTTGKMFKVEKIADDQLKQHVGKRVEVTGRIDAGASSTQPSRTPPTSGTSPTTGTPPSSGTPPTTGNPPSAGTTPPSGAARDRNPVSPDRIELPEFEAVSIKEVPGSCPSKPSAQ